MASLWPWRSQVVLTLWPFMPGGATPASGGRTPPGPHAARVTARRSTGSAATSPCAARRCTLAAGGAPHPDR